MSTDKDERRRGILKAITDALTQTRHRNGLPYDGIMGMLPDWMPAHLAREFFKARDEILREYSHADALEFLRKRRAAFAPDDVLRGLRAAEISINERAIDPRGSASGAFFRAVERVPPAIRDALDALIKIQDIEARGLDAYLGKAATDGLRAKAISGWQSRNASGPRERMDTLSAEIYNILLDNPDASENDVWAELESLSHDRQTIQSVTDGFVEWVNAKGEIKTASRTQVKHRISRMRKKLRDPAKSRSRA